MERKTNEKTEERKTYRERKLKIKKDHKMKVEKDKSEIL